MKAVVLLSKKFFPAHFRAGEATDFKTKVLNGQKRHTCRCNYEYWKKKITALQEKSGTLCLRQWADKPYRSPQESILEVPANMCIVQPLILRRNGLNFTAEVEGHPVIRLMDEGNLSLSFILSEFPKIANKESRLPRGQRDVVANIVFEAARRVVFLNQQERARKAAEKANEKAAGNDI